MASSQNPREPRIEPDATLSDQTAPRSDAGDADPQLDADVQAVENEAQVAGADVQPPAVDPVAEAQRERDEYLDALRRERAEFENFRKRTIRERTELLARANEQLISGLLDVLDSFELAMTAAQRSEDEGLAKGVVMVHEQLLSRLRAAGLEEIPGEGRPFDPEEHEAMLQVDAEDALGHGVDEPTVVEVLRTGYRYKGRTLRPASVKVAK
ncbi:MAG TPA: nucleotide exchange factor GrpE [Egibacteraceae bacterium]|nr:nucleotide exchange factor GrpE [Egibacteraceae bacterium]